jgi:hypothetical protein
MTEQDRSRPLRIPTEADWGDYQADVDQKWAQDQYLGCSNEEMQKYFRSKPIEAASDLQFMPEIPFRYYVLGYRDCVMACEYDPLDASDAASCFLNLVASKLEKEPRHIVPVMPELMPALQFVAENQARSQAEEEIYGKFREKFARIQTSYAKCKDRYRRCP